MKPNVDSFDSFDAVKARLDEIVAAVGDESMPLDDALDLYEEAVALGMRATDLLETGIEPLEQEEAVEADASEEAPADNAATEPEGDSAAAEDVE